jgi:hypothetical protein
MGITEILDRYQGRISASVAEDSGGRFDIPLIVEGVEVACINLRAPNPIQLYRNVAGGIAALAPDGSIVPLP